MAIPITKKIKLPNLNKIKNYIDRESAREEIQDYIIDTILDHVSQQKSPVSGGAFKKTLSPAYKKIKSKESGSTKANLELTGDMLDSLSATFDKNTLTVGINKDAGEQNMLKAENHNKFTKRAMKTKVPARQFIPRQDENFKRQIMNDIQDIIDSYASED